MAVYTYEIDTTKNYPNLTVYKNLKDGVLNGYRVNSNDGYVMYDTNDEYYEIDEATDEEVPVTYYFTVAQLPKTYNFDNFSWVAVLRSEVDENYIFGTTDPKPEVM